MSDPISIIIIPARGGSKGIPLKNLIPCAGKPLVQWTIETAVAVETAIPIMTSDHPDIVNFAFGEMGVITVVRPPDLAADDSPTEDTIEHTLNIAVQGGLFEKYEIDIGRVDSVVLLQPTSPVRTATQIREMLNLLREKDLDSVVSVTPSHHFLWNTETHQPDHDFHNRPMRQQRSNQAVENGSIYAFTLEHWRWTMNRLGGRIATYPMGEDYGLQVDSEFDLWMVEKVLERKIATDPDFHVK